MLATLLKTNLEKTLLIVFLSYLLYTFIDMQQKRLSKTLAAAGVASRRACEALIFSGQVTVNGTVICIPQTLVTLGQDEIRVKNALIQNEEKKLYFILNKPKGFICSNKRLNEKKLVIDLFASISKRLFTIGRLDRDTTGLLLLTNDGHYAQKVIHPSNNIAKEYLIKTKDEITHDHLIKISKGTLIEGRWIKPISVKKVRRGTLKIVVKEGKKREVRLLATNASLSLLSLMRIRIGALRLDTLAEGSFRELSHIERSLVFE